MKERGRCTLNPLETRAFFVDTSVFFRRNFDIEGSEFASLMRLGRAGQVRLILTKVTIQELETQIEKKFYEFVEPLRTAQNKTRILQNLGVEVPGLSSLLAHIETGEHLEALKGRLRAYLEEAATTVLDVAHVSPQAVFDLYFDRKPPFGKDKKKNEFPDAFALAAIKSWCEDNGEKIYVISADGDMKAVCDEAPDVLLYTDSLPRFLEGVLRDQERVLKEAQASIEFVRTGFERLRAETEQLAREEFEDLPMYLADRDGEAHEVRVHDVYLETESVISLSEYTADFSALGAFGFEADVAYVDPGSGYHYDDTRSTVNLGTIETTIDNALEVTVEVSIEFDPEDLSSVEVTRVSVNSGDPLWVKVDEVIR